jgi:drug/metabolite transporter (DMT)-like permease
MPERASPKAIIVLALLSLIWGYSWIFVKIGLRSCPPLPFGALRVAIATVSLFAFMAFRGYAMRPPPLKDALIAGVLQTALFIGLTSWAVVDAGVGKTSVLVFTMPFWTLVFAWPMLGERIRGWQWLAVVLAFAGLLLVLQPWTLHGNLLSSVLALTGGMVWALSAALFKRMGRRTDAELLSFTAWQMLVGSVPLALGAWLAPSTPIHWSAEFLIALTFNSVVATALGWVMWVYVLHRLPAGTASMSTLAIPVIAVLSAWWQLGEVPDSRELTGMLLIGIALALLSILGLVRHQRDNPALAQE